MKDSVLIVALITCSLLRVVSADDCITVTTWDEFTTVVNENESVTFCPFSIEKPETERLLVKGEKKLRCAKAERCEIRGPGTHIRLRDRSTRLVVNGFIFVGATKSSIHISNSSPKTHHVIRRCIFRDNYGRQGGAIRTESGTILSVFSTRFDGNKARSGGGIGHSGKFLHIENSAFKDNLARRGAGIFLSSASARVQLKATMFLGNTATVNPSGAISARSADSLSMIKDVTASDNGDCNGVHQRSKNRCYLFENGEGPDDGTSSCASIGSSCEDNVAGCCAGLQCSDSSETCEKEEVEEESKYSYSGSACKLIGPEPTSSNTVMKFLALGDTPYDEKVKNAPFDVGSEYKCLQDSILPGVQRLVGSADFIVHVGDIKKGGSGFADLCNDQVYRSRRDLFEVTEPELDFLLVAGDNEWNECKHYNKDPRVNDEAKGLWRKHFAQGKFADFNRVLPYGGSVNVERQPGFSENFFFYYNAQKIAFFGITEPANEDQYDPINADWIATKLSEVTPKAVVIFAHSRLSSKVLSILPEVPTLHVAGNAHKYCMQKLQKHPFVVEVTVDAFKASPLLLSIVKDTSDNHFFHVEKTPYGC